MFQFTLKNIKIYLYFCSCHIDLADGTINDPQRIEIYKLQAEVPVVVRNLEKNRIMGPKSVLDKSEKTRIVFHWNIKKQ